MSSLWTSYLLLITNLDRNQLRVVGIQYDLKKTQPLNNEHNLNECNDPKSLKYQKLQTGVEPQPAKRKYNKHT